MKICISTVTPGYTGAQTIEVRAADKGGNTLGSACEMAVGGGEQCCDTGYRGFAEVDRIHFDVKTTSTSAKMREVTQISFVPDPSRYARYNRQDGKTVEGFAGVWLKDHTMCGMGFVGTCSSADAGMFDAKYDIFKRFAIGTDRACREGFIEVNNSCGFSGGTGSRVVCRKIRDCKNAQSR